jgi:hypothetical protein
MEKELSAMQELIENIDICLDDMRKILNNSDNYPETFIGKERHAYNMLINYRDAAKSLLPKEKAQIVDAFKDGFYAGCDNPMFIIFETYTEDYYNNKYNQ